MTLTELFFQLYAWADQRAFALFLIALLVPAAGLVAGWIARGSLAGRAAVVNALALFVLTVVVVAGAAVAVAVGVLSRNLLEANALLLLAPVVGVSVALLAQRTLMPLGKVPVFRALATFTGASEKEEPASEEDTGAARRLATIFAMALIILSGAIVGARQAAGPQTDTSAPLSLAFADIENQTGEDELDGLSGLLITSLGQSRRLEVMSRLTMFDVVRQLGRKQVERIDESLAREVCRKAGTAALAVASLRRFDQVYSLELSVLDVESGKLLFTAQEKGTGKAEIPSMLDRIAERTRAGLSERASEIAANRKSVSTLATSAMDAYQRYFEAEQAFAHADYEGARKKLEEAVGLDPNFGLAHFKLAYLSEFNVRGIDQAKHVREARATLERAPARDQLLMRGWFAQHEDKEAEAIALFERALAEFPPDKMAHYMAGDVRFHDNDWRGAIPFFEKAIGIDPTFVPALHHLTQANLAIGRLEETLTLGARVVERQPDMLTYTWMANASLGLGREDESVALLEKAISVAPPMMRPCFVPAFTLLMRMSKPDRLLAEVDRCVATPGTPEVPSESRTFVAFLHSGQWRKALAAADKLEFVEGPGGGGKKFNWDVRRSRVALLAELGELEATKPLLDDMEARASTPEERKIVLDALIWGRQLERARSYQKAHDLQSLEARLTSAEALARKAYDEAAAALLPVLEEAERTGKGDRLGTLIRLAQIRTEQGRFAEALPYAEKFLSYSGHEANSFSVIRPNVVLMRGKAHEAAGKRELARADYQQVVAFWQRGDADLPGLREARARLANF